MLLAHDCYRDIEHPHKKIALDLASQRGHLEVVRYFLEVGAGTKSQNLLHLSCNTDYLNLPLIKYLVEEVHYSVCSKDHLERTPIFGACADSHLEIMEYLVEKGADPHETDIKGCGLLHIACEKIQIEVIRILLSKKFSLDPNEESDLGDTPLHVLMSQARYNHSQAPTFDDSHYYGVREAAELLLKHGADPTRCNKAGKQAIDVLNAESIPSFLVPKAFQKLYNYMKKVTEDHSKFE